MTAAPNSGRTGGAAIIAASALMLTAIQHGTTLGFGFYYDDYHFVRPYTAGEVLQTFHAPWDASGIELPYYRPLTICLYAARFHLLGLNSEAYHALSLLLFGTAAALFGILAARVTGRVWIGLLAAAVFTVHPGMPYSAVAWVTNQMHLLEMLLVLAALAWWFAVRRRPGPWWMPLLVAQAAVFLVKEDGIMLIPVVIGLHYLRKAVAEPDLRHVPVSFVLMAIAAGAALLLVRESALSGVAGHRPPALDQAWSNLSRALSGAFWLVPARRPFQPAASWFAVSVPLLAAILWPRVAPPIRFAMLAGVCIAVLFALPFVFVVKAEQLHLVTAGASLFLAASAAAVVDAFGAARALRAASLAAVVAGLALMSAVSRDISRDFLPFGPSVLRMDAIVQEWAAVPQELREYLQAKRGGTRPPANPADALDLVGFGLHGTEMNPAGVPLRWMAAATSEIYVPRDTRLVTIPMRHEIGAFREPARVRTIADGRIIEEALIADGAWRQVTVALKPNTASRLSRMHRLQVRLDRAWIPAAIIPGSPDRRTLGLQIGVIQTRRVSEAR